MPRATTKAQLIESARTERAALEEYLATLTAGQMTRSKTVGEWSAKDVMAHLIEWEQMVLRWYEAGAKGRTPAVPSKEFNWGQLPKLNHAIYLKHRDRPLGEIRKEFRSSHRKIMKRIDSIPEKELFTPGRYAWTGKNLLAAYFASATGSHYRWARTVLRKGLQAGGKTAGGSK